MDLYPGPLAKELVIGSLTFTVQKALPLVQHIRRLYESVRVVSVSMGQALGLAAFSEARASACVSIYSRVFVSLPFRTVKAKTQSLERLIRGFDFPRSDADDQNPVSLRHEFGRLWISRFYRFGRFLKHLRQSRVPAVRAGQRPVLAWNDPLNIFGNLRKHTLLIAAAYCCKEIFHNLNVLFDAHRNFSISLTSIVSELTGRFGTIRLEPNHTVDDRLLLFLGQILEDESTPSLAACVHQRATLVELSQLDGCESEFFGQIRHCEPSSRFCQL